MDTGESSRVGFLLRPASLPLMREVAKPQVLTEGEIHRSEKRRTGKVVVRDFLSLSQLR